MKVRAPLLRAAGLALIIASVHQSAGAQPTNRAEPAPIKLHLETGPDLGPGSVAVAEGTASLQPVRFVLEGVDVSQAVSVVVATTDPTRPVKIDVVKEDYNDPQRSATTAADGTATVQFRTHGDFGVSVVAASPVPFLLAVWAGPLQPPATPSFLAPVKGYDAASLGAINLKSDGGRGASALGERDAAGVAASAPGGLGMPQWALLAVGVLIAAGLFLVAVALFRRRPEGTHA